MSKSKIIGAAAAVVVAVLLGAWIYFQMNPEEQTSTPLAPVEAGAEPQPFHWTPPAAGAAAQAVDLSDQDKTFLDNLRNKFAKHINSKHAQIKAIEQVIAYLMAQYPDDWQRRVREFLAQLFPELADQLYAQFEKLAGFNNWLRDNHQALSGLPPGQRRAALWDARRAAFGADAEIIWQGELRNEKVIASLQSLDQLQGQTPQQKFDHFLADVNAAYGEDAPVFIENTQTELLSRFLSTPSVQTDLGKLPRAAQHAELRSMRAAVGMDEAALTRWDQLDASRDQAWDVGQSYELQRAAILAQHQGEAQRQKLNALQDQLFGAEAEAIRSEEAAGFYRYAGQRRVGRE